MNRSSLGFFLIFFIAYASTELLPFCYGSRPFSFQYPAEQKRNPEDQTAVRSLLRNAEEERVEVNRFSRARGVYGGDNAFRHKAKKSGSMASMTKSASIALAPVAIAALVNAFLY